MHVVQEISGIVLGPESTELLEARLTPLMSAAGLRTGHDLLQSLRDPAAGALREHLLDCVATHETSFFRDPGPFEALETQVLPGLARELKGRRPARVWCAACSTGQEPYSVAMLLQEMAPGLAGLGAEILATDLSRQAVARARAGLYSQMEVNRGLTPERLARHFREEGRHWRTSAELRKSMTFRQHNLARELPPRGGFDVIFCRNVLIYLGLGVRARVFEALHAALAPEGYLFLGAAESPRGIDTRFQHFGRREHFCYRRVEEGPAARAA